MDGTGNLASVRKIQSMVTKSEGKTISLAVRLNIWQCREWSGQRESTFRLAEERQFAPRPRGLMAKFLLVFGLFFSLVGGVGRATENGSDTAAEERSPQPLDETLLPLTEDPLFRKAQVAVQVVDVETGEEMWGWNPDDGLVPASVTKVLTSATALRHLGPQWRFSTELYALGEVNAQGVLEGDLIVRGTGDPTLVVEKVWKMIKDLRTAGVVSIEGDIIFDATYFDSKDLIVGWDKPVDITTGPAYFAPLGGLSVNFNTACLIVGPGAKVGEPARIELETASNAIKIVNEMETGKKGTRRWVKLERETHASSGKLTFTVSGHIPLDSDAQRYYRAVGDPLPHFMGVFRDLMNVWDIGVKGSYRKGQLPEVEEDAAKPATAGTDQEPVLLVSLVSPPLAEILNHTNKYSSNFMAEQVLKAVGAEVYGAPGSTAKGVAVIQDYLGTLGIAIDEFTLVNGSGLTRDSILRPSHVNAVLLDMLGNDVLAPEFLSSLSVAGVDGTLRNRFDENGETGRIRGKTGSLNHVYCLAGIVNAGDGHTYVFTFFVNGFDRMRNVRKLHDRFARSLLEMNSGSPTGGDEPASETAQR